VLVSLVMHVEALVLAQTQRQLHVEYRSSPRDGHYGHDGACARSRAVLESKHEEDLVSEVTNAPQHVSDQLYRNEHAESVL